MIEISGLTKKYGQDKTALDNISFIIKPGVICGYIGTNGAGKTTTIKILTGMLDFDSGNVKVAGINVKENPLEVKRITGYVPESGNAFNSLTTKEYLAFTGKIRNLPDDVIKSRTDYFADFFDYAGFLNSSIGNLSKGTKQKILITSALIHNPEIILLDEPLNGLDANTIFVFQDMIKSLAENGKTIFYCSHLLDMIEKISTKLIILESGKIKLDSDTVELKNSENYRGLENLFRNIKSEKEYKKFRYEDIFA
ncbi:MAG: ABC transporter ATP-binding protein [Ignavibacteriae bacterium]|nr:ABC transporter ATP-binding protein [Ignavibacteriota bacterium]